MFSLKPFRDRQAGVSDLLNWAALVDSGIIQCKDGSLLAGFIYQGPNTESASHAERNYLTVQVNRALSRFGKGWSLWVDETRKPVQEYPLSQGSAFPDAISLAIDDERKTQFEAEKTHFESQTVLMVMSTPPSRREQQAMNWLNDVQAPSSSEALADKMLAEFNKKLDDLQDALSTCLFIRRMGSYSTSSAEDETPLLRDELVNHLQTCLTGIDQPVNIPPYGMYLDAFMGGQELLHGEVPRIGENYIQVLSLEGFPPRSHPQFLEILNHFPMTYRWNSRMIFLEHPDAITELQGYRRKWAQKVRGFWSQMFKTRSGRISEDALLMAKDVEQAIADVESDLVTFGYYTSTILMMGPDPERLKQAMRLALRELQRQGFTARIETFNTTEAWLGSLPGHIDANVRRPLCHTLTLSDALPLSGRWQGEAHAPCPYYPKEAPPLLLAASSGQSPFAFNLHVGDVGHTLIFGPTGAGKSTLLAFLAAQFRRYPNASICGFDKGQSLWAINQACGGLHYEVAAESSSLRFAPLSQIDRPNDRLWAQEWLATCYELRSGSSPTPAQSKAIHQAIELLQTKPKRQRTLSDFLMTVQDEAIRSALSHYSINGPLGDLLDSRDDGIEANPFTVFELEALLELGEKNVLPVLLYLFKQFERSLQGQPALLLLDEAWVMLGHPVFREKIREWLKVLRKANCAVVLATQSLSDAMHSGIFDVLVESCPTKILLPNEEADKGGTAEHPGPRDLYTMMGLNATQIQLIKSARKKRHYYVMSSQGQQLVDLELGPLAMSFIGVSDKASLAHLKELQSLHGDSWPSAWLTEREIGVPEALLDPPITQKERIHVA